MAILSSLPHGMKISITRSITTAFEHYMEKIMWDEKAYSLSGFFDEWRQYIQENASWYNDIPEDIKTDPMFHEELAGKINQVISKVFAEAPTEAQINELDELQKRSGTDYDFSCKAEARFYIDYLKEIEKKKQKG